MPKELESVKLDKGLVDKVRLEKERSGVSITRFIEDAVRDKLAGLRPVFSIGDGK